MSRLTDKNKFDIHYSISISKNSLQSAYDKLGKLEDLEEQIGVNNLIAFLEWCVKFRNNFINRSFDDMVAFYKRAMCVTEKDKSE